MTADPRWHLEEGDCLAVMPRMPNACVDSVVTDPPYGLAFMGKKFDTFASPQAFQAWSEEWAREALRVLKPGAHAVVFGGTRTYHRIACALEDAGFEIRDCLMWLYGCLSDDTELLVDGRWERCRKGVEGHLALCYDAEHDVFTQQPIEAAFFYAYDDTAFRVRGDSTDQIVTREHRCLVGRDGAFVFVRAEEAAREREARVPVLEDVSALLAALRVRDEGAGNPEQDMLRVSRGVVGARFTRADLVRFEPIHYNGTVWCVKVPTGAFVARRNGKVFVTGNSGFPKSHNVSKDIDKAAGAARPVIGPNPTWRDAKRKPQHCHNPASGKDAAFTTAPATDAARRWQGWGTALKPAWEPIILARKPLVGTVAANVLAHGTGALNIDGCSVRSGASPSVDRRKGKVPGESSTACGWRTPARPEAYGVPHPGELLGRFPANVVLSHSPDCTPAGTRKVQGSNFAGHPDGRVNAVFGADRRPRAPSGYVSPDGTETVEAWNCVPETCPVAELDRQSAGGASRFFYTAKAGHGERWFFCSVCSGAFPSREQDAHVHGHRDSAHISKHPTVKPAALMRWLCRLVTPPGGIILDPFAGSGSTGVAALAEGFRFAGIEQDPHYCVIARARIAAPTGDAV